jgi:hypothetical protein
MPLECPHQVEEEQEQRRLSIMQSDQQVQAAATASRAAVCELSAKCDPPRPTPPWGIPQPSVQQIFHGFA